MSLQQKAIKGVIWSIVESWGSRVITFVVFFMLARLLGAEAFGLVALASTFVLFVGLFVDQGFSRAIIQHPNLQPEHLDTAFWTNIGFGIVLTIVSILNAGWIANLLNQPALAPVVCWLSLSFISSALISVQQGLFLRNLNFKALALRSLVAITASGATGLGMAFLGFGVWSLVGKELVYGFVRVLMLWWISDWRPGFRFSPAHFKELFNFGINVLGLEILRFLSRRSDDLLIGIFLGPIALAYYSVAYRFLLMTTELLVSVIQRVAISTFAKLQQEPAKLRSALYQSTQFTSLVSFPIFLGAAVLASEIIHGLLGESWNQSIPVMRILALVGIVHSIDYFNESVMIAVGKPEWTLKLKLLSTVLTVTGFIGAIKLGTGITGVAVAFVLITYLGFPISIFLVKQLIQINVVTYFKQYLAPLVGALGMVLVLLGAQSWLANLVNAPVRLIICAVIGSLSYLLIIAIVAPSLFKQVMALAKLVRPKPV